MKNYYEILEVNPKASTEMIENAYKILSKKYQPDQYVGDRRIEAESKLRDISEAYKILTDTFLREQYDAEMKNEKTSYRESYETQEKSTVYKEDVRPKKERKVRRNIRRKETQEEKEVAKVGSFGAIVNIVKNLFRKREGEKFDIKNLKREDYIAAGLTAVIIITLGIILWFIPATNGFIRSLIPF